jgi:hypothetical protein
VALGEKNHPLERRDLFQELNQANSRGTKRKKELTNDDSMQNESESRPRKGRGRGASPDALLDLETSYKPTTVPKKPGKRPVLK